MGTSQFLDSVKFSVGEAKNRGLLLRGCTDESLKGRNIRLDGKELVSFGSCSYLGLEMHPALIEGAKDALDRYGTQFSSSRSYLSSPLYHELEDSLSQIFGGHALVTPSTSMGHLALFSSLITEKDAIVLDHQTHNSVHVATRLARAGGTRVELARHGRLEESYELIRELAKKHRTVWFACDGIYSMYGNMAPINILQEVLDIAPNVRLYVDDAHGMSWAGEFGKGSFLSRMPLTERTIVATSLNKAFSAGGGCLIFSEREEMEHVRLCGGPLMFSGPVQNPMLGAAVASARLHLSGEIYPLQRALRERVLFLNKQVADAGFPLMVDNDVPICFVQLGAPKVTFEVCERLIQDGFFPCAAIFPAVPARKTGVRIALTANHTFEQIRGLIDSLAHHVECVLDKYNLSRADIDEVFKNALPKESYHEHWAAPNSPSFVETDTPRPLPLSSFEEFDAEKTNPKAVRELREIVDSNAVSILPNPNVNSTNSLELCTATCDAEELSVQVSRTIHAIEQELWDKHMGAVGSFSWSSMASWEKIFSEQELPENNWGFYYVQVFDEHKNLQGMTCFTHVLNKDDMLDKARVSEEVERLRSEKEDPYFLTSWCIMMGTMCSEGNHLFLDKKGPWKTVLEQILQCATTFYNQTESDRIMLRDLPSDDPELDQFFLEQGYVKVSMLDTHRVDIQWSNTDDFLMHLDLVKRRYVRKYMLRQAPNYTVRICSAQPDGTPALSNEEIHYLHSLYTNVARRKLRLNVFPLPEKTLQELACNPDWEFVLLILDPAAGGPGDGRPVGYYVANTCGHHYTPFFCGLDYDYVEEHGAYRQALFQCLRRGMERSIKHIHMGMDADFLKERLGSISTKHSAFVQSRDHFNGVLLSKISTDASVL